MLNLLYILISYGRIDEEKVLKVCSIKFRLSWDGSLIFMSFV